MAEKAAEMQEVKEEVEEEVKDAADEAAADEGAAAAADAAPAAAAAGATDSEETVEEKMEVPKEKIGAIIGQRGSEIVRLEMESGAKINMPKKEQVEAEGKAMVTVQLLAPCCARVTHALRAYSRQLCDTPGNCADHWTGDGNREGKGNDSGAGGCSQLHIRQINIM